MINFQDSKSVWFLVVLYDCLVLEIVKNVKNDNHYSVVLLSPM